MPDRSPVIARLDRAIQTRQRHAPLWIPRSSRGMTGGRRGGEMPRPSRGMTAPMRRPLR
jgi:hypothetical protein